MPNHDAENAANATRRSDRVAAAIIQAIPDGADLTLLDYGCGTGPIGLRLAHHFHRVILTDVDPMALHAADVAAAVLDNVTTRLLDLTQDIPTGLQADVIVSCLSWHHVPDLDALLTALPAVAPGGALFVAEMDPDDGAYHADHPEFHGPNGFDRAGLAGRLARHGYNAVTTTDLFQGAKWVNDRLTPLSVFLLQAVIPG